VQSRTAAVGSPGPDFALVDQHGEQFRLSTSVAGGPIVLVFLRGFG
jgi:peroxiredoxin